MADAGAPAPVFKITLFSIKETQGDGVNGGVNGGVNELLEFIKATLNLSQRTLERWLKELRDQNKIEFQGSPKAGGYYFLDK